MYHGPGRDFYGIEFGGDRSRSGLSAGDWSISSAGNLVLIPLFSKDLAAVSHVRADLPGFGAVCTWAALYSFGTCGRGFSLEHPGTERTGTAGRAGMVSQKSQANLTQERRGIFFTARQRR